MSRIARIAFSHNTALRIHRLLTHATDDAKPAAISSRIESAPRSVASPADVAAELERLALICARSAPAHDRPIAETYGEIMPAHVLVGARNKRRRTNDLRIHLFTGKFPSGTISKLQTSNIADPFLLCSPELAFAQVASADGGFIPLLELGYELCGTYQTDLTAATGAFDVKPLTSKRLMQSFLEKSPGIRGRRQLQRVVPYLADGSASPRETKLALLLGLPRRFGGYGLGIPVMNHPVFTNDRAARSSQRSSLRCDLCWPQWKVDVEYQSRFAHAGEIARMRDSRRTNALASMGWKVVGVTNEDLDSISACETIAEIIRTAIGKQRRYSPDDFERRNFALRRELGLPCMR